MFEIVSAVWSATLNLQVDDDFHGQTCTLAPFKNGKCLVRPCIFPVLNNGNHQITQKHYRNPSPIIFVGEIPIISWLNPSSNPWKIHPFTSRGPEPPSICASFSRITGCSIKGFPKTFRCMAHLKVSLHGRTHL